MSSCCQGHLPFLKQTEAVSAKNHPFFLSSQVLTAIYPAQTVALATGVVSVTAVPPSVAAPAQDAMNPSSPLEAGVQGSAVPTPQPGVGVEVEVKQESQLDSEGEESAQGVSSCTASSSLNTCASSGTTGNAVLVMQSHFSC